MPRSASTPLLVALTGGIASGKTTVSDHLASLGVPVVDTDAIAHALTAPSGAALPALRRQFGEGIFTRDGALDRQALRQQVFADPQQRKALERILHPLIEAQAREAIAAFTSQTPPYVLVVVPLLVETGVFADADLVVVVDAPETEQLKRLQQRDGLSRELAERMLAAQASRDQRLARADLVLDNSAGREQLLAASDALHGQLCARAAHGRPD